MLEEFELEIDLERHVLWQYDKSPKIRALVDGENTWFEENCTQFLKDWYSNIFDLKTANEFGISVWSKILDFPLFGEGAKSPPDYPAFGFDTDNDPMDQSPIEAFADGVNYGGNFATDSGALLTLSLELKRILLLLKYYKLTGSHSVLDVNRYLTYVFGPNEIYMLDGLDMTITYVLLGPKAMELAPFLPGLDILPRGAGVELNFMISSIQGFGFADFNLNFDNGSFLA